MSAPAGVKHAEWEHGDLVVHYIDQVGNDLTHRVRWCTVHACVAKTFGDGSIDCSHDRVVGWSPHEHREGDLVPLSALPGWHA